MTSSRPRSEGIKIFDEAIREFELLHLFNRINDKN
jgi:hypothetical protein